MSVRLFAYGSNMCRGRLKAYKVNPQGSGVPAVLRGYRLRFNKRSTKDGSGKANIEQHEGCEVWGVVYEIPDKELDLLDGGEVGYERCNISVHTSEGVADEAWVYVASAPDPDPALRPYTWYKRFLVDGSLQHRLPEAYIQMLQALDADEDSDHDRDQRKRELHCSE